MSAFYNYLSKLPDNVLNKCFINDKRVIVPISIDKEKLYLECFTEINKPELGPEKALYIVLIAK